MSTLVLPPDQRSQARSPDKWSGLRPPTFMEVVIPALNEEGRITRTIEAAVAYLAARPWPSSVVVVDNGSVDRTADIVHRASTQSVPVHLVGCSLRGKGAAVRRGVMTGRSTLVGYCDADLATPFEALDDMLPFLEHGHPVVVGSRHTVGSEISQRQPILRRIGGHAFRTMAKTVVPSINDTQCGFKFFHGAIARQLFGASNVDGFAFDVEILSLALRRGIEIKEVPVAWSDVDGSSFNVVRDGVRTVKDILAMHSASLPT